MLIVTVGIDGSDLTVHLSSYSKEGGDLIYRLGGRYKKTIGGWTLPARVENLQALRDTFEPEAPEGDGALAFTAPFHLVIPEDVEARITDPTNTPRGKAEAEREAMNLGDQDKARIDRLLRQRLPEDFALYPFQLDGVTFVEATGGVALIGDAPGCIDGNAVLHINRAGKGFRCTLEKAYKRFNGKATRKCYNWDRSIPTYARALCDGELRQHLVRDIVYQGKRPTLLLRTATKTLRLTPDHEVAMADGSWRRLDQIRVGDRVVTDGEVGLHVLVAEMSLGRHLKITETVHHRNGFRGDNRPENLEVLTVSEHHRRHSKHLHMEGGRTGKGGLINYLPHEEEVLSIQTADTIDVYDVVMDDPHRNVVANGIVVHNCGKTVQALAYMALHREITPTLVVCPKSAIGVWLEMARELLPDRTTETVDTSSQDIPRADIVVLTYGMARELAKRHDRNPLNGVGWKLIICDEAHRLNNWGAQQTRVVRLLAMKIPHRLALSGTPIWSKVIDFQGVLRMLRPDLFPNKQEYGVLYCGGIKRSSKRKKREWWEFKGVTNQDELQALLSVTMIRRRKEDVLSDLPRKRWVTIPAQVDLKEYKSTETRLAGSQGGLLDGEEVVPKSAFEMVSELRALTGRLKVDAAVEWITDFVGSGEPLVVFYHHRAVGDGLQEGLRKQKVTCARIDGSVSHTRRTELVARFQAGGVSVILMSLRAGSEAVTLTRASDVLFVERDWVPAVEEQAEDRVCRIGQERPVTVWRLMARGTIDDDLLATLKSKWNAARAVLEGTEEVPVDDVTSDVARAVLRRVRAQGKVREFKSVFRDNPPPPAPADEGDHAQLTLL